MGEILLGEDFQAIDQGISVALQHCLTVSPILCIAGIGVHEHTGQRLNNAQTHTHQDIGKAIVDRCKAEGGMDFRIPDCQPDDNGHQEHIAKIHHLLF